MYAITEDCIACGICLDSCPSGAIAESFPCYRITEACVDCHICSDCCPEGAIVQREKPSLDGEG